MYIKKTNRTLTPEHRLAISESHKGLKFSPTHLNNLRIARKGKAPAAKTWEGFVSPIGQPTTIINLTKFCEDNDLSYTSMLQVYKGIQNKHRGWTVSRSTNND